MIRETWGLPRKGLGGTEELRRYGVKEKRMSKRNGNLNLYPEGRTVTINRRREGRREDKQALTHLCLSSGTSDRAN